MFLCSRASASKCCSPPFIFSLSFMLHLCTSLSTNTDWICPFCVVNISWRGAARSLIVAGCRCRSSKETVGPLTARQNRVEEEERLGYDRRRGKRSDGKWGGGVRERGTAVCSVYIQHHQFPGQLPRPSTQWKTRSCAGLCWNILKQLLYWDKMYFKPYIWMII